MEIICNITEILNTDKEKQKKNRLSPLQRAVNWPELGPDRKGIAEIRIYILVCQ